LGHCAGTDHEGVNAREGILINGGAAIESLARIDTLVVGPGAVTQNRGMRGKMASRRPSSAVTESLLRTGIARLYVATDGTQVQLATADGVWRREAYSGDPEV